VASPTPAAFNTTDIITAVTSHALNLPAGASTGDRILFAVGFATDPGTVTPPTGMTVERLLNQPSGGTAHLYTFIYEKQGSETTCTLTTSVAAKSATCAVHVTGDSTTTDGEITAGAIGTNGPPNPDLLTPAGGSQDYLFIAIGTMGGETAMTAAPTNYTNFQEADTGTAGAITVNERTGIGTRQLTGTSDDPGVFTGGDATQEWVGMTAVFYPAGAAPTDLVIQDAAHAHAADNLALTQVHSLAVADALHAHSADSLVLTQVHQLAIQDALHSHTADNVVLEAVGGEVTLVIQDAVHSHAADSLDLTQVHELLVADASHSHAAENVVLDAGDPFKVQNLIATGVSGSQVDLTWDDVVGLTGEGYDIERDAVVIVWFHGTNSYSDTGLDPSTTYTYRVRASETV
jgi:hypothetical protein